MTEASYFTLASETTQFSLLATKGERPRIIHWGAAMPGVEPSELDLLGTRQWVFGGPNVDLQPSLMNELGAALGSPSGFLAHRASEAWASVFRTSEVVQVSPRELRIRTLDEATSISAVHDIVLHEESDVLAIRCTVTNEGDTKLTVDWSAVCVLPIEQSMTRLMGFTGRWANEFQTERIERFTGSYLRENRAGRTSHDCFPGIIALEPGAGEQGGRCKGFHLAWSGNSRLRVDQHSDGRASVQMGELFLPGEMTLKPGESYESPQLLASCSDAGLNGLSQRFHRHVDRVVLDRRTKARPRPVHFNTWEAVYFDHNEEKLLALAEKAAAVGAERFVLDDGWFGARRNDRAGLGDWTVASEVYPRGLHRLADRVRELGMEFGIWFEPEMVNPDSDLYRQHPDWVLHASGVDQVPERNQLALDLTKAEVCDYLFGAISSIVENYGVAYIKWDMNRDLHHPGTDGGRAVAHQQTRDLYSLLARLRKAYPELEIETCSSGGGRADFGILRYTDRVWSSDNNDARERQAIQRGASYFFPLKVLGSHVGPKVCHITGRALDMRLRVASAIFGHMGMEVDLSEESEEDLEILKKGVALYKEHRLLLHDGVFHRLETPSTYNALSVVSCDRLEALVSCAKLDSQVATHPSRLRFAGLADEYRYRVRLVWPAGLVSATVPSIIETAGLQAGGSVFSGRALMTHGMQLPVTHPDVCLVFHLQADNQEGAAER
ncbi:alpha-galactosidase [Parvularcula lutaonensis]|uniref:alpha-galactosidase n=1 Tax=Parvularcula lutaonensis TaxID=491923 RepID=A0ABV7MB48_9PROT|nr:alpha-galactosidase [Parvularcula lutaonensis]GGY37808.1 alpha-galactosidase [Parvularcula lutaonensis]